MNVTSQERLDANGRTGTRRTFATVFVATLVLAGCGGSEDGAARSAKPAPDPTKVSSPKADSGLTEEVGSSAAAAEAAGCTLGTFAEQDAEHVDVGDIDRDDWNSFPPTSGAHYENWAPFGVYDKPLDDGYVVHNLEHGGVAVWYGDDVSPELVSAIDDEIGDGEKWLLAPRDGFDGIASSAWGKLLYCDDDALTKLGDAPAAELVSAWFDAVESTGSEAEKDVPGYAGAMEDPKPTRDVSVEAPFG